MKIEKNTNSIIGNIEKVNFVKGTSLNHHNKDSITLQSGNGDGFFTHLFNTFSSFFSHLFSAFHSFIRKVFFCFDQMIPKETSPLTYLLERKATFEVLKDFFQNNKKTKSRDEFTKEWKEKYDLLSVEDRRSIICSHIIARLGEDKKHLYNDEKYRSEAVSFVRDLKPINLGFFRGTLDPLSDSQIPQYLEKLITELDSQISSDKVE